MCREMFRHSVCGVGMPRAKVTGVRLSNVRLGGDGCGADFGRPLLFDACVLCGSVKRVLLVGRLHV